MSMEGIDSKVIKEAFICLAENKRNNIFQLNIEKSGAHPF
jgi:hypothetical protein